MHLASTLDALGEKCTEIKGRAEEANKERDACRQIYKITKVVKFDKLILSCFPFFTLERIKLEATVALHGPRRHIKTQIQFI